MRYERSVELTSLILTSAVLMISTTLLCLTSAYAQKYKMETVIPGDITTPDKVDTRLGTLKFDGGYPDAETVQRVYDNLDFQRGFDVFLNSLQGASLVAIRRGLREVGATDGTIGVFNTLMDSKSLFLTANADTVYAMTWIDLSKGPVVIEGPPNSLGIVDDFWFRYVADLGNAGPDKGKGGKFLFLPPGYTGKVPKGYFVFKSRTFGNIFFTRGFLVNGDPGPTVESFHKTIRTYPLSEATNPHPGKFVDLSGKAFNTVGSNTYSFYEDVNEVVQEEPADSEDPELLGQLLAIGIQKGKPFAPDERMKKILTDSVAVGNATARAIEFRSRTEKNFYYPGKAWFIPTGFYLFLENGARLLDPRTMFFYGITGVTPAMVVKMVGVGSQYAIAALDSKSDYLQGGKNYKLNIPANPPAKNFWSVTVYDAQTRSMLQTDQRFPWKGSNRPGLQKNADGSYDLYFGPMAPAGKEGNWIQTVPGRGWFTILRLYGPLEPWFDKTWRPGDIEPLK
jgi:hypothetical protein